MPGEAEQQVQTCYPAPQPVMLSAAKNPGLWKYRDSSSLRSSEWQAFKVFQTIWKAATNTGRCVMSI